MFVSYLVVTCVTILANAAAAVADVRRAGFVLANMAEVGIPEPWLPPLAALKAAGAAGLLVGVAGVVSGRPVLPGLGIAAASGLALFFTGALLVHLRARVVHTMHFPGTFWLLAIASLALAVAQSAGTS